MNRETTINLFLNGDIALSIDGIFNDEEGKYWWGGGLSVGGHWIGPRFLGYETLDGEVRRFCDYATKNGYDGTNSRVEVIVK